MDDLKLVMKNAIEQISLVWSREETEIEYNRWIDTAALGLAISSLHNNKIGLQWEVYQQKHQWTKLSFV